MSAALQNGDTDCRNCQRFSRSFLQSLAMLSGPAAPTSVGPFAYGTVTAIAPLSRGNPLLLATVRWADGYTSEVNVRLVERGAMAC